jgi:hypothetical protein
MLYFQPKMDFFDRTFFSLGTFWQLILKVTFLCYILRKKLCNPKCNHNMNWYVFRTCVLCFFHLSLVKTIVKSAKYTVVNMPSLWKTITLFHKDEVPEIIKLAQYAFTLPLHTCSCERVFSNQNLIVTRLRSRLIPKISDRLLRVRTQGKGITKHDLQSSLNRWRAAKNRLLKRKTFITV